jgi:hypothetical protein
VGIVRSELEAKGMDGTPTVPRNTTALEPPLFVLAQGNFSALIVSEMICAVWRCVSWSF